MVLGPNGMPHYQQQYASSQVEQGQSFDGSVQQHQASYDFSDQGALKGEGD